MNFYSKSSIFLKLMKCSLTTNVFFRFFHFFHFEIFSLLIFLFILYIFHFRDNQIHFLFFPLFFKYLMQFCYSKVLTKFQELPLFLFRILIQLLINNFDILMEYCNSLNNKELFEMLLTLNLNQQTIISQVLLTILTITLILVVHVEWYCDWTFTR